MFFVRNELRTRRRFRFCTPCGHCCFNFHFFSFSLLLENNARKVTELDNSSSSITIFTLFPRKSERPRARYRHIEAGWHIELDKLVSSSVAQKTKLIQIESSYFVGPDLKTTRARLVLGSYPKYNGPDYNSHAICYRVRIKEIGSELIFGCDWKKW